MTRDLYATATGHRIKPALITLRRLDAIAVALASQPLTALQIARATQMSSNEVRALLRSAPQRFEVAGLDGEAQHRAQLWKRKESTP